jgi:hypothetical protein
MKDLYVTLSISDTQQNNILPLCRVSRFIYYCAEFCYAQCRYAKCRYAECRYAAYRCATLSIMALSIMGVFATLSINLTRHKGH